MATKNQKIAIFPASGGLGSSSYNHLLRIVAPKDVVLISRYPEKLKHLTNIGVETRQADYDKAETLDNAFVGVSCLFLISYASIEHQHRTKVHKLAIDAARKSGVTHIFYSSLAFGGDGQRTSAASVMQAHLDTEAYLAQLARQDPSFTYTAIREGIYSESFNIYTAFFDLKSPIDTICIPHDGSGPGIAWAKQDELGEASARLIANHAECPSDFPHKNTVILLSGPRVWSLAETANVLSAVTGRQISIRSVSMDQYISQPQVKSASGYGAGDAARTMATALEAVRNGETAVAKPLLADLLGRDPEPFDVTVAELAKTS
ncbi:hypothetical protein BDV97DRAFT_344561 [Delphinella strobiligena]|nr:hypothetical protein BDV97DRAFT_344561 [Delphinella strobiligena]